MITSSRLSSELSRVLEHPGLHEIFFQNTKREKVCILYNFNVVELSFSETWQSKEDYKETREIRQPNTKPDTD